MIQSSGGVYPLTPSIQAKIVVSDEIVHTMESSGVDACHELYRPLRGALADVAATLAEEVTYDCMFVWHVGDGDQPFTQAYVARRMPGVNAKAELRGGHADGELFEVARNKVGVPAPVIKVPAPMDFSAAAYVREPVLEPKLVEHPTYRLVGFRPEPAVWVYDLDA